MTDDLVPARSYRAICFDLDGTLLPMDIDVFMGRYFQRIAEFVGKRGLDAGLFMKALKSGTEAMAMNEADEVEKDVFWAEFAKVYDEDHLRQANLTLADVEGIANDFYRDDFGSIGDGFEPDPLVAKTVDLLIGKGYPLVLTTMPMFPLAAVHHRLDWAGVDPASFQRITTYENSKSVKPRQSYYAENLAAMGLRGSDVLMVGNNTVEDLAFADLGVDAYLITDWLLNPNGFDVSKVMHGSFADFAVWCEGLPECKDPVSDVEAGAIAREAMQASFDANIVRDIDQVDLNAKAKALAEDIASH